MAQHGDAASRECSLNVCRGNVRAIDWDALVESSTTDGGRGAVAGFTDAAASSANNPAPLPITADNAPLHIGAFPIPENLARRALFWHDVYTRYGTDDYILHLAEFPEVVLETASAQMKGSPRLAQSYLKRRKFVYRTLLMELHRHAVPARDLGVAARIAGAMAHITDRNKYYKAALSLRIQRGQKEFIEKGLAMVRPYAAHIEAAFIAKGLPGELAYVAFVESSFNVRAVSKVGASGVYQLMPAVARSYMRVTDSIDERRDPIKSAQVAARIMHDNYALLGDWPLAITAYNHGAIGMQRAARRARSKDLVTINERYHGRSFGFASKNFYTEFLGIMLTFREYALTHPEILPNAPGGSALAFANYRLPRDMPATRLIRAVHATREELLALNPDLSRGVTRSSGVIPRGYVVKLPVGHDLAYALPSAKTNLFAHQP